MLEGIEAIKAGCGKRHAGKLLIYPVTLPPDEIDGSFIVTFVDLPEAITQADTEAEALTAAKDALEPALDFYFEWKNGACPLNSPNVTLFECISGQG